jgi:hypothetical protein
MMRLMRPLTIMAIVMAMAWNELGKIRECGLTSRHKVVRLSVQATPPRGLRQWQVTQFIKIGKNSTGEV